MHLMIFNLNTLFFHDCVLHIFLFLDVVLINAILLVVLYLRENSLASLIYKEYKQLMRIFLFIFLCEFSLNQQFIEFLRVGFNLIVFEV